MRKIWGQASSLRARLRGRYRVLPSWIALALRLAVCAVVLVLLANLANSYQQSIIATALIYAVAAIALTALMGWVGRASVMTAATLLAGGYCAVFFSNVWHLNFLVVLLLTVVVGAAFGFLAAIPARRLDGIYLLLSTLAIYYIVTEMGNIVQSAQGALGGYFLQPPVVFGATIVAGSSWIWVAGVSVIVTFEYFRYLRRTRVGRAWIAIRDNEDAARVAGVPLGAYVMTAFTITTAFQFLAGALLGYLLGSVSYNGVSLLLSINFIVMIVLGGMGSLPGAIVGALIVTALPAFMNSYFGSAESSGWLAQNLVAVESVIFALIGIVVLLGLPKRLARSFRSRQARRGSEVGSSAQATSREDPTSVETVKVSVQYAAGETAVNEVSMGLHPGQTIALVGRNGAGKSSLLYAIAGFPPGTFGRVSAGQVWWTDATGGKTDISSASTSERTRVGIILIPAEDKVFVDLTVREHLREALVSGRGRAAKVEQRTVDLAYLLSMFPALEEKLARPAGNLSGGERQQLALAMAIARTAKVMLIDEATLGLAPIAIKAVEPVLRDLGARLDGGLIIAEQNPTLAMRLADRVMLLDSGEVVRNEAPSSEFLTFVEKNYLGLAAAESSVDLSPTALEGKS